MTISPQKFREVLLGLLFSHDFYLSEADELSELVSLELKITPRCAKTAYEKMQKILPLLDAIDSSIAKVSTSYEFERIGRVERNVLRLAVYEMLYEKELDTAIIIAEAKRLAKKFSTPESGMFCKAILDTIGKTNV